MDTMAEYLLAGIINYGAPLFGATLMLGALGFPIPTTLLVVASGAFARQGNLNWLTTAGLGLAGVVVGDSLSYLMGRWAGKRVIRRFEGSATWRRAQETFNRGSGMAVFLTRFLLTGIASPVNLLAGGNGCAFKRFLFYDVTGEVIWIVLFSGLGYLFSSQWEVVSQLLSQFGGAALGAAVVIGGIYGLVIRAHRNIRVAI